VTPERVTHDSSRSKNDEHGTTRAVLYLRVSTKEQATKGGEAEGYSIPAQRQACVRKAKALGATIIDEFLDAGESARSSDRPQLQELLTFVGEERVDYVIVHKVDRLARNRVDDVAINVVLKQAGATLVSCSENIDETPSGMLLHGIMSSIAEFYSRNLASEVTKGLIQKAKNGGTLGKAPVGYLNVRKIDRGREIRTVTVDAARAPLVQWAFEEYASGDWSLTRLTNALADRGLTNRPTTHFAEKPLTRSNVHRMLRNRYYVGTVTWQGVEYQGSHPTFIDKRLFEHVQEILTAHNVAGEKQRVHNHYLKGSVWCASCGSRLCITKTTNRHGTTYLYFFCLGRNQKRTTCTQKAIPVDIVETHIENKWSHVRIDETYADLLRELLEQEITARRSEAERDKAIATNRIANLKEQRRKLLEAHYADAIALDLLKSEQDRIAQELGAANKLLEASEVEFATIDATLRRCLAFVTNCHEAYLAAPRQIRRQLNQAVFERFLVGPNGSTEAELTQAFSILLAPDLVTATKGNESFEPSARHDDHDWLAGIPAWLRAHWNMKEPRPTFVGLGLNKGYVVPPAGFEPALPA
jgi:site-specific DNA recombinase